MIKLHLRQIRERRFLTQGELAERVGMSRAAINRIEQGGEARMSTARKLAEVLEVDPEELIDDSNPT